MKGNKSPRAAMGTTLPTTLFALCVMFIMLLALDVVSIQINTRFVGPSHRSTAQAVCSPLHCDSGTTVASTTSERSISEESGQDTSDSQQSVRSKLNRYATLVSADLSIESNITFTEGLEFKSFEDRLTEQQEKKWKQKILESEPLHTENGEVRSTNGSVKIRDGRSRKKPGQGITKAQLQAAGLGHRVNKKLRNPSNETVEQKYTFKMHAPGSLDYNDMQWCPGLRGMDLAPVDEKFKFLFILGAQKAGTTWLHQALTRHKLFVEADSAYGGGWAKEVRFFNSYPIGSSNEYLNQFASKKRMRALYDIPTVFLDSTPNSLFSPAVAPRVKAMVPHAKFVIVLRDPVARTVSSHNMMYRQKRSCYGDSCARPTLPLLQEFRKHRDLDVGWPENLSGCNFNEGVSQIQDRKTWGDCWRCDHFVYSCQKLSVEEQHALGGCDNHKIPHVPTMPLTQYGLYAAQIAWWLSFFPPESFIILTREELQDPDRVVPALNKILEHVGHPDAKPFTEKVIGKIHGYRGKYTGDMSGDDQQALKEIADFFEQPNKDLQTLMDTFFPDAGFTGFMPEYTAQNVNPYANKGKDKGSRWRPTKPKHKLRAQDKKLIVGSNNRLDFVDAESKMFQRPEITQERPEVVHASSASEEEPLKFTHGSGDASSTQEGGGSAAPVDASPVDTTSGTTTKKTTTSDQSVGGSSSSPEGSDAPTGGVTTVGEATGGSSSLGTSVAGDESAGGTVADSETPESSSIRGFPTAEASENTAEQETDKDADAQDEGEAAIPASVGIGSSGDVSTGKAQDEGEAVIPAGDSAGGDGDVSTGGEVSTSGPGADGPGSHTVPSSLPDTAQNLLLEGSESIAQAFSDDSRQQ